MDDKAIELARFLSRGAREIFDNALALFDEASMLATERAWARGLFLHQISLEECAKIEMLGAAITSLLMGYEIDVQRLRRAFSKHGHKNRVNAYMLPTSEAEENARDKNDVEAAMRAFKEQQEAFHKESNSDKNGALYVDLDDEFTSPLRLVSEEMYQKVRVRNEEFLAASQSKINLITRWDSDWVAAAQSTDATLKALDLESLTPDASRSIREAGTEFASRMDRLVARLRQNSSEGD